MTYETTLGDCQLVINYDDNQGDVELGTILMKDGDKYVNVTDLVWELTNVKGMNFLEKAEQEIKAELKSKPSYLNED